MTFEMFGAGSFGMVIGFVAWHVFRAGEGSLDPKQLAAFIGALLGAVVLAAFPAGTSLFASYSVGLALGFFLIPTFSRFAAAVASMADGMSLRYTPDHGNFAAQMKYLEDHWPEVARVIENTLVRQGGSVRISHLAALPLDESGRRAALKKFARTHPERAVVREGFFGLALQAENLPRLDRTEDSKVPHDDRA
jgi:hypothetical protein